MTRQSMFQAKKESQPLKTSSLFRRQAAQAPAAEQEPAFPTIHLGQDYSAIPFKPVHPAPALGPSSISCPFTPQRCPFGGACHACPPKMQAKLKIGQPGDKYEQEADRVAEQVMRMPEPQVQRKCSAPGCKDEEEKKLLQTKPANAGEAGAQVDHPLIQSVLSSPGQPLDAGTRSFMEPRFGQDFSGVRVHVGGQAAESARAVNARAYTVGRDVVFGEGQYVPGSDEGKRLVAHELVHVGQQRTGLLQLQANTVTFEPDVIKISANRKSQLLKKAGWQQRSVIMTINDFKGEPLGGHQVFVEFKAPDGILTEVADVQGGSAIWSNIWLKPNGTVRVMAVSTGQPSLVPTGVAHYMLPNKGPVKFKVDQEKTETTVTAKTSEEAASKAGVTGTAGIEFEIFKISGEVSSEESKTKGSSLEISWKVVIPTRTFNVTQLP